MDLNICGIGSICRDLFSKGEWVMWPVGQSSEPSFSQLNNNDLSMLCLFAV